MAGHALRDIRLDRTPLVSDLVRVVTRTWDERFDGSVIEIAAFITGRIEGMMDPGMDCVITFGRVPIESITVLNPQRVAVTPAGGYPILARRLASDPSYDSVPIALGRSARGVAIWDGHRRFETYRSVGRRDVPAWTSTFRRGSGLITA